MPTTPSPFTTPPKATFPSNPRAAPSFSILIIPTLSKESTISTFYAIDSSENISLGTSLSILYTAPEQISLTIDGQGSVTGVMDGATLLTGKTYPLVAKPAPGWFFAGWSWTDDLGEYFNSMASSASP